ncbi:MAG: diaminopimelate decarboxylase [Candidatus Nanopelagicales bacterium]
MIDAIWPRHAERLPDGGLRLGGCDARSLAAQYGTPLFVVDELDVRSRAAEYKAAYDHGDHPFEVFYASKAFLTVAIARWVHGAGLGIDVATGGELAVALRAGIPGEQIVMHGNNKSRAEIEAALEHGLRALVCDSLDELARIGSIAAERGLVAPVMLRLTAGVEAHTHEAIATAHEDQKFGLSIATGMAAKAVDQALGDPHIDLRGFHSHIGSQIFDADGFEIAAHRVALFMADMARTRGYVADALDLGGGMGIPYVDGDDPLDVAEMAHRLRAIVVRECSSAGIAVPRLSVEPGRAIVGSSTVTLYEVGVVKQVQVSDDFVRQYVAVDGGMSDNIRTALYNADYTAALANRVSHATAVPSRVVGKHCESGDIVVNNLQLPTDVRAGDLLAVATTGAYCWSMASNYNNLPRPAVIAVRDGASRVLIRRETAEDLLARDQDA